MIGRMDIGDLYLFCPTRPSSSCRAGPQRMFVQLQRAGRGGENRRLLETSRKSRHAGSRAGRRTLRREHLACGRPAPDAGAPHRNRRVPRVHFAYKQGQKVLDGFNLSVPGADIALVGRPEEKDTIVGLLCRFYEPTSGEILINGEDYRTRPLRWLQTQLGVVLQTPHLFTARFARTYVTAGSMRRMRKWNTRRAGQRARVRHAPREGYDTTWHGQQASTARSSSSRWPARCWPIAGVHHGRGHFVRGHRDRAADPGRHRQHPPRRLSFVVAHRLSRFAPPADPGHRGRRIVEDGTHRQLIRARGVLRPLHNQFAARRRRNPPFLSTA